MKLTRLRIAGFKTFVDPVDFLIEPGLTGVVGPNGCGKSNLVEALRWVMGESSHKSLRASGMEDVIFAGTTSRPARNMAEVALAIDNSSRSAPAAFNDAEELEVSRRIARDDGSTYRVNGREVRARDVQLLFADAATGARSPAMVRQGQIGEIINAKPSARRRILEDAAGVAGLHGRRHEAELRLKAAEENLTRVADIMKQIDSQVDSLKRQSRQASRYKSLSADIRRVEAALARRSFRESAALVIETEQKAAEALDLVTRLGSAQAEAAKNQAVAAEALPRYREAEAEASAALQRLVLARESLDAEEKRANDRLAELERRAAEFIRDLERENSLVEDAGRAVAALQDEDRALETEMTSAGDKTTEAREIFDEKDAKRQASEAALAEAQSKLADITAKRSAIEGLIRTESERVQRLEADLARTMRDLEALAAGSDAERRVAELQEAALEAQASAEATEAAAESAREAHRAALATLGEKRKPLEDAERQAQRLETEVQTLSKLLSGGQDGQWPAIVDAIRVEKGYEAALGAALGDDLDASIDSNAPVHWSEVGDSSLDPALPDGVTSLASHVEGPAALTRRLRQIGLVTREQGEALKSSLRAGQRLVTTNGDLWRWDGLSAAADAPTAAARRLVEKNRLGELDAEASEARRSADLLRADLESAEDSLRTAADIEARRIGEARGARTKIDAIRFDLTQAERQSAEVATRRAALDEAKNRLDASLAEARAKQSEAEAQRAVLPETGHLDQALVHAREAAQRDQAFAAEARAAMQTLVREDEARARRRLVIADEIASWTQRRERAIGQSDEVARRRQEVETERAELAEAPNTFAQRRRVLALEIESAEDVRKEKADARASAESELAECDRQARDALASFSSGREDKVRADMHLEAARERLGELRHQIEEKFETTAEELLAQGGDDSQDDDSATIEVELNTLKAEREKLGAVNLRADDELNEIEERRTSLSKEEEDLTEAIRRLRAAITSLNKEGRERLLIAFEQVQGHFTKIFTTLFGGGTARLELIESEDPLEAGLEILAHPPGKKPSTMSLLSGGEQALTAIALIFAVFLTNPSPICVLDEVDAPLDDANVERYCDLLDEMARATETRFVVITHNPITMARMDRLFGVTMAERGVSQLVSVDLATAETFREAS